MLTHNSYFDGKVQSVGYTRNQMRATVGVIDAPDVSAETGAAPAHLHFNTAAAERMTVVSGCLHARLPGGDWVVYPAGTAFEIAANSGFDVIAVGGPAAYLCEFLGA